MGMFEEGYRSLNDAQRTAVDRVDGPVLVIAGPGTGKTQLLALRAANILQQTDADASNILCLTFTESAQATMQQRLVDFIADTAYNVSIHTFHSFASEVILRYTDFFDKYVTSNVADSLTSFEILQTIFEKLPHGHPLAAHDGASFVHLSSARSRISHAKQAGLLPKHLLEIVTKDSAWLATMSPKLQELEQAIKPSLKPAHLPLYEAFLEEIGPADDYTLHGFVSLKTELALELSEALEECRELGGKTKPLTAWRRKWILSTKDGAIFKDTVRLQRLEGLAEIYEQYRSTLRDRHLRDFDDLLLNVTEKLQTEPDLQAALQEQFQYILVDEYQDTNGVQQQLIELLADNPVHEKQPNLMVVGDDDQAIYGFQGANPSYMRRFDEHWHNVLRVTLTENYRSTPEILNLATAAIAQADYHHTQNQDFIAKQLTPHQPSGPQPRLLEFNYPTDQYWGVANEIADRIASGQPANEIAIIAPRHRMLAALVPYLLEKQVPINYDRRDNVLEQPHILQLLHLARTVQAVADNNLKLADALLPELLSYPFWDISTAELWSLQLSTVREEASWLEQLRTSKSRLGKVGNFLLEVARQSHSQPLDIMLDILLGNEVIAGVSSPYKQFYFSDEKLSAEPMAYVNMLSALNTLRQRVQQWGVGTIPFLKDLLQFVQVAQQANEYIVDTHPLIIGSDSVTVLTAHKAKGQEFKTVFLLDSDQAHWVADRGRVSTISLPANLPIEPEPEEVDEKLRRFYVALTRAAQEVVLTRSMHVENSKTQLPLMWLTPEEIQPLLSIEQPTSTLGELAPSLALTMDWRKQQLSQLERGSKLRDILSQRLATYHLSASHLNTFLDLKYGGPKAWLTDKLLGFPRQTSSDAIYGTTIHSVLEHQHQRVLDGQPVSVENAVDDFSAQLAQQPLDQTTKEHLQQRGERALRAFIGAQQDSFSIMQRAEFDVPKNQVVVGAARLYGKIDVLDIDQKHRTITVTDYKTGRSFADWQPRDASHKQKLHAYRRQLIFYKLLIEHSHEYHDYVVTAGQLVFVEPDENGKINRLEMTFDETEVSEVKQLIQVIWRSMTSLNLPSPNGDSTNANRAFEQQLLETELPLK